MRTPSLAQLHTRTRVTGLATAKLNRKSCAALSPVFGASVSEFVIHCAPDSRMCLSSGSSYPIHFAFQFSCWSNPVSHQLTSLGGYGFPSRPHTRTRQKYRLLG